MMIFSILKKIYKKPNVIIVESPLQLLNVYEAIHTFEIKDYVLIIRLSNSEVNDKQIRGLLNRLNFKMSNIVYTCIRGNKKKLYDLFLLFSWKLLFLVIRREIDKVIVGNPQSGFVSLLLKHINNKSVVIVDDGNATIDLVKQVNYEDVTFFSNYKESCSIHRNFVFNDYSKVKENVVNNVEKIDNKVLFIGTGISELGIMTSDEYVYLLKKIVASYSQLNKTVLYIPHRVESETKVYEISQIDNVEVFKLNAPIELACCFIDKIPSVACSFYSSALITMKSMYNIEAVSYKFDYSRCVKYKEEIDGIYEQYSKELTVRNI